jgi:hypothetical protein
MISVNYFTRIINTNFNCKRIMKLIQLLLISTALALTSQVAQATVVNTLLRDTDPANTDILCREVAANPPTIVENCWTAKDATSGGGGNPGTSDILSYFDSTVPGFDSMKEVYKAEYGNPTDVGPLAGSYSTVFTEVSNNVEHATINYDGGSSVDCTNLASPCFVLIKGGTSPFSYLFNLALGWDSAYTGGNGHGWSSNAIGTPSWNGTMELELRNFGNDQLGSISHVALYGNISAVPVPAAFWLFGTALMCFIGLSRSTRV